MTQVIKKVNTNPVYKSVQVTPDDGTDLPFSPRAISYSSAGTIAYTAADGNNYTTATLSTGVLHPISQMTRILATGTTASGIEIWA